MKIDIERAKNTVTPTCPLNKAALFKGQVGVTPPHPVKHCFSPPWAATASAVRQKSNCKLAVVMSAVTPITNVPA